MEWEIDRDADVPIHEQVENLIRQLIEEEEYQKGKLLPGESEIAEKLDISRNTVRMSMKRLVREGLIVRKKGIGSRVRHEKIKTNLRSWISFTREMNEKGLDVSNHTQEVSWVLPPKTVVNKFQVDPHIQIPQLKRVHEDDTGPIILFLTYLHPRLDIDEDEDFNGRLYEDILEPEYDVTASESEETIEATFPDRTVKDELNIERRIPILYRERMVYDEENDPIEYNECYYRGDRCQYDLRMQRDEVEMPGSNDRS